ncbi:MAG: hypothetical protein IJ467_05785 [Bacteroidaceae bacterium]|nr:hypothetical protein [Bacteroidaceae bacterium]MBQ6800273.1 hypothetical protein [Bacteroidaceae bacterium]MBQ8192127.1 hypothetical protein [Bacteroidaceae bacterium]MBQ8593786.1 hypothetical protein [Bacteroidaceae bacterium]
MKEEQEIIRKCGKGTPFKVPEGYFEDFTRNLMAQLPEKGSLEEEQPEPSITPWQRIKPLLYLAAMFIGMIVCVRVVLGEQTTIIGDDMENATASEFVSRDFEQMTDEELCTMVEYTMMDNYTLYQYLSEVE